MCVYVCAHEHNCMRRPEEGVRSPGAGLTGGCESPDVEAGNGTPGALAL